MPSLNVSWEAVKWMLDLSALGKIQIDVFVIYKSMQPTVSHKSEYTPHIFANILIYFFKGQHWRNYTLIQCKVVSVQLV